MKIVINTCFGGFSLSDGALRRIGEIKGAEQKYAHSLERDDPALVQVVEEMGEKAGGRFSELRVVEIPDGVQWQIEEYDGNEHIAEVHRTWG